jgi:hypothetical protein
MITLPVNFPLLFRTLAPASKGFEIWLFGIASMAPRVKVVFVVSVKT